MSIKFLFFCLGFVALSLGQDKQKLTLLTQFEFRINDGERRCNAENGPCGPISDMWGSNYHNGHLVDNDLAIVGVINGLSFLSLEKEVVSQFVERKFLKGCLSERRDVKTIPSRSNIVYAVVDESYLCKCVNPPCQRVMNIGDQIFSKSVDYTPVEGSKTDYKTIESKIYYSPTFDPCIFNPNSSETLENLFPIVQFDNLKCKLEDIANTMVHMKAKGVIFYHNTFDYAPPYFKITNTTISQDIVMVSVFKSDAEFIIEETSRGNELVCSIKDTLFSFKPSYYSEPDGLVTFDLSDMSLGKPKYNRMWFDFARNLYIEKNRPYLYASGVKCVLLDEKKSCHEGLVILDISDPMNPVKVSEWKESPIHAIDTFKRGSDFIVMGSSMFEEKVYIFDVTDLTNGIQLITTFKAPPRTHSISISKNGDFAFIVHQVIGFEVSVWDIEDFNNIKQVTTLPSLSSIESLPHNMLIDEDKLYLTHFADGVAVYDIKEPESPSLITKYDTSAYKEGFHGAWGIHVFNSGKRLYVSDIEHGLFAFDFLVSSKPTQVNEEGGGISKHTLILGLIMGSACALFFGMCCMYCVFKRCIKKNATQQRLPSEEGEDDDNDHNEEIELR